MSLEQKFNQLIGQWDGSDATERMARRDELVRDLVRAAEQAASRTDAVVPASLEVTDKAA